MHYQIGLAALTFDPEGALLVPWRDGTETDSISRRITRTATLDGGAAISNRGYSPADRTITLSLDGLPLALVDRARRLLRLHGNLTVSLREGTFAGVPSEYNEKQQTLTILLTAAL
ncbi:hypothetical protein [Modicisalibacter luteus]|uniref:Phage tail protein n=1 Tax=Modicisalibacter luteus TaxID=453962 RepID=A0ABV7M5V4_9GAMM|nr:hypothetical protein [Halomonas lutea]GHA85460.1 hypothetical protein GCM10007159_03220 [Halomonas lutea]